MATVAIYDMDKTITRRPTLLAWLVFWARAEAPWRLAGLLLLPALGLGYRIGMLDRAQLKEWLLRLLMGPGCPRAAVAMRAEQFADRLLRRGVRADAVRQIAADRAAGCTLLLATASNDFYVNAIARALGMTAVVATRAAWDGDRLRPRLAGPNCYAEAKAARVAAWLADQPHARIRCYSDHVSDAPLFERADVAVAVSPSAALRRMATQRGWTIVDWR